MSKELLHIWGPFSIQSYGLSVLISVGAFIWFANRHPLRRFLMPQEQFNTIILVGTLVGVLGGRTLFVMSEWQSLDTKLEAFMFWQGGLSILGSIIAMFLVMPLYLYSVRKSLQYTQFTTSWRLFLIAISDLGGIHAPLMHAIARVGCFFAGCCYGSPTQHWWATTYTSSDSLAPCFIALHPAQLYSATASLLIFIFLYISYNRLFKVPGQCVSAYLVLISLERFFMDFFRGDTHHYSMASSSYLPTFITNTFSIHQCIALVLVTIGCISFIMTSILTKERYPTTKNI